VFGGYQHVYITNPNGPGANDFDQYVAPDYSTGRGRATYTIGLRHNF
jgi:hypothetical protein